MPNINYYLGPSVQCQNIYVPGTITRRACPNDECAGAYHKLIRATHAFCFRCGSAIRNVHEEAQVPRVDPKHYDLPNITLFPAVYVDGWVSYILDWQNEDEDEEVHHTDWSGNSLPHFVVSPIDPETIKLHLEWLQTKFAPQIEILKQAFGESNVKVVWGLVSYWIKNE
ncbi:MAG: hypothetical protein V3W44_02655 [Dehalococcoidales bacterium]